MYLILILLIFSSVSDICSARTCDCTIALHLPCQYLDTGLNCERTDLDNTGAMWPGRPVNVRMEQVNLSSFNLTWHIPRGAGYKSLLGFQIQVLTIVHGIPGIRYCVVYNLTNAIWSMPDWFKTFFLDCIDVSPGTNAIAASVCSLPLNQVSSSCSNANLAITDIVTPTPDPIENWNPVFKHSFSHGELTVDITPAHPLATQYTLYLTDESAVHIINETDIFGNECKATFTNVLLGIYRLVVSVCDGTRCREDYLWRSGTFTLSDEPDVIDCERNPCLNGGDCLNHATGYECLCINEYYGQNCENGPQAVNSTLPPSNNLQDKTKIVYISVSVFAVLVVIVALVIVGVFLHKRIKGEAEVPFADNNSVGTFTFNDEESGRNHSEDYRQTSQNGHDGQEDSSSMGSELRKKAQRHNATNGIV